MTDLAAFILARLDEAQERAWAVHDVATCDALLYEEDMADAAARTPDCDCGYPARVLREVAAKRAILDLYVRTLAVVRKPVNLSASAAEKPVIRDLRAGDYLDAERELCVLGTVARILASVSSDHPDYDASWKP